MTSAIILRGA